MQGPPSLRRISKQRYAWSCFFHLVRTVRNRSECIVRLSLSPKIDPLQCCNSHVRCHVVVRLALPLLAMTGGGCCVRRWFFLSSTVSSKERKPCTVLHDAVVCLVSNVFLLNPWALASFPSTTAAVDSHGCHEPFGCRSAFQLLWLGSVIV